jgi:hypothetical protein
VRILCAETARIEGLKHTDSERERLRNERHYRSTLKPPTEKQTEEPTDRTSPAEEPCSRRRRHEVSQDPKPTGGKPRTEATTQIEDRSVCTVLWGAELNTVQAMKKIRNGQKNECGAQCADRPVRWLATRKLFQI